ncbi:MAG: SpoIIE family protein phosphatase [Spirochaetales bacterium]|nr:SpoIIE family protein phosphatase [Spirochaetales bacterium]
MGNSRNSGGPASPKRILIVEDNAIVALEIEESLCQAGYEVVGTASNGHKAIELTSSCSPDLILMDIKLEGKMDGTEVAKQVQKSSDIPVVFLSAYSDRASIEKAKSSHPYGYIIKPYNDRTLLVTIEVALHQFHQRNRTIKESDFITSIINAIGGSVIVVDSDSRIHFMNDQAQDLFCMKSDFVSGKEIIEIMEIRDSLTGMPISIPQYEQVSGKRQIIFDDCLLSIHNNPPIHAEISFTHLLSDTGQNLFFNLLPDKDEVSVQGIIIQIKDISNRKKRQKSINLELEKTISMQKKLLPENGLILDGYCIDWLFIPATFGAGDFFGFYHLDNSRLAFYTFDVMGHGIIATITSLLIHRLLNPAEMNNILTNSPDRIEGPADVLCRLNKHLYGREPFQFVSIIYGIIDTRTGITRCARGGHHYPLLLCNSGETHTIRAEGPALGFRENPEFVEYNVKLGKNDRICLFSDGLTECKDSRGIQFSQERLIAYLEENNTGPGRLISGLSAKLFEWKGSNYFDDDITFVLIDKII